MANIENASFTNADHTGWDAVIDGVHWGGAVDGTLWDVILKSEVEIAEYVAPVMGYAARRRAAYAKIADQLDMQFHDAADGTTVWRDHVAKVKADNPK
tara:strand:+ start:83 stop:376 length:294 start_codon:yes stop_codon:yes gene_type:complete